MTCVKEDWCIRTFFVLEPHATQNPHKTARFNSICAAELEALSPATQGGGKCYAIYPTFQNDNGAFARCAIPLQN